MINPSQRYQAWSHLKLMQAVNRAARRSGDSQIVYKRKEVRQTILAIYS